MEPEEIEVYRKAFTFVQRNRQETEAVGVFEKLSKIIPDSIIEQVKNIKSPIHCIFIKNDDYDLTLGIVSHIYNTRSNGSFTHLSYSGYTDQEVISGLFPPSPPNKFKLDYYLRGRPLFISGLGNNHQLVFERLLGAFREINFSNPYKKDFGYLVISIKDTTLIPQELIKLSDVIAFERKNQKKGFPASTQQNIQGIKILFYDDAKRVLFLEEGEFYNLTKDEQNLVDCLREDSQNVETIIGYFRDSKKYFNTSWNRGNFDKLISDLNKKTLNTFGVKLVKNLEKGQGLYGLSVKTKDKKFKK